MIPSTPSPSRSTDQCKSKTVTFSSHVKIIFEPDNLVTDLHKARVSDFARREADRYRMGRLLSPILSDSHRQIILERLNKKS